MSLNHGYEYRAQIDGKHASLPLVDYLAERYRHSGREEWQARAERGEIYVDGTAADPGMPLKAGQWLTWRRPPWDEPDVPMSYALLYEDEDMLAVAKPCGLPTMPAGGFLDHTLLALVRRDFPGATPVHRLGRGTSGIVLFARTATARSGLAAALRDNRIAKLYRALAGGSPEWDAFTIECPIGPVPHTILGTVHGVSSKGRPALSRVRVLERREGSTLVEVRIETGRPHQIRIHLAAVGLPLVGDPLYAAGGGPKNIDSALPGDLGYSLHAERIELEHPVTRAPFQATCPPPPQLRHGWHG